MHILGLTPIPWFDTNGIDMVTLATYPSDDKIGHVAVEAHDAAESLFAFLGVVPPSFMMPPNQSPPICLPGIETFFSLNELSEDTDNESLVSQEEDEGESTQLQSYIEAEERVGFLQPVMVSNHTQQLTFAVVSASVDDTMHM